MPLQEKYKFLNLGWSSKTKFGSWENGSQEKKGLSNINNVRKLTSQLLKHKCYSSETSWSGPNGLSPLGIWAKWVVSIMFNFIQTPF